MNCFFYYLSIIRQDKHGKDILDSCSSSDGLYVTRRTLNVFTSDKKELGNL
jgi:hypothetical protein